MEEQNNIIQDLYKSREKMLERGFYTANKYEFKIKPIYLGEERDFLKDFIYVSGFIPQRENKEDDSPTTDLEKVNIIMSFFSKDKEFDEVKNRIKAFKKHSILKILFYNIFGKKPYISYDHNFYSTTMAYGLVKWLEKKVYYKNKLINFYDLEHKYNLSKIEIYDLIIVFLELSNFPPHLPKKKM